MPDLPISDTPADERGDWLRSLNAIAVFRALQLGDLLCVVPALRALRAAAPQARITLIGLPWAQAFARRFHAYVDDFIVFPGFPGLPEQPPALAQIAPFLTETQGRRFDLAIQLHGSGGLTNPLVMAMGARETAGFHPAGATNPDPARFLAWREEEHEVLRYLDLMEFLGAQTQGEVLEFPLTAADQSSLLAAAPSLAPHLVAGDYVCIHPGARLPSRRWMPERFAAVADRLADAGLQVVITGSESERPVTAAVVTAMRAPALDLTGSTDLGALAALIASARLVVCNDTGISHVASAVATPSVIVCSGALADRWAPLNRRRHRLIAADVPCRPCMHWECPIGHPCARNVTVDEVAATAFALLADNVRSVMPVLAATTPASAPPSMLDDRIDRAERRHDSRHAR